MAQRRPWPSSGTLDDIFLDHYAGLVARARQLVGRDRHAAEDLVHDVYVRLALRELDLGAVANVEGYLFTTLRNVYLSQVRRNRPQAAATVSIIDHESLVSGLRSLVDAEERQNAFAALRHIVRYACLRKTTSKAASVLLLRFFHGYYPGEIARILRTTEVAVAGRLRLARAEARGFLADPARLQSFDGQRIRFHLDVDADDAESVRALRRAIFAACTGPCLSSRTLDRLYASRLSDPLDVASLAHLVGCGECLDAVSRRLGLPLLVDRNPSDRLGRGGPTDGGGSGAGKTDVASTLRARLDDARADHPKELQIAVNGLFVGSQEVNGRVNGQRVKILVGEPVGFVEIFDEHHLCLLYLDVEPPPSGAAEQSARVTLTDGRHLSATLSFADASPMLHVVYENPSAAVEPQTIEGVRPSEDARRVRRWTFWPVPVRFALAGLVLGVLLGNPRQTLAAAGYVRHAIVDSIGRLVERARPRPVLPSRSILRAPAVAPYVVPSAAIATIVPRGPVVRPELTDLDLSEIALETLRRLDDAGALTREQIEVTPRSDRRLHVEGLVDSESRRDELMAALRDLPAGRVRVDLATFDEAARRQSAAPAPAIEPLRIAEVTRGREPAAYESLRRHLIERGTDVETAVRRSAGALLARSLRARVYAGTVRDLVARVSPADVKQLSPSARQAWLDLVLRHAELFRQETAALRAELEQLFPPTPDETAADLTDASDDDAWAAAARLFALASAHDLTVRQAFAVVAEGTESLDVSTAAVRRSLLEAEHLALALRTAMPVAATP